MSYSLNDSYYWADNQHLRDCQLSGSAVSESASRSSNVSVSQVYRDHISTPLAVNTIAINPNPSVVNYNRSVNPPPSPFMAGRLKSGSSTCKTTDEAIQHFTAQRPPPRDFSQNWPISEFTRCAQSYETSRSPESASSASIAPRNYAKDARG